MSALSINSSVIINHAQDNNNIENNYLTSEDQIELNDMEQTDFCQQLIQNLICKSFIPEGITPPSFIRLPDLNYHKIASSEYWALLVKQQYEIQGVFNTLDENLKALTGSAEVSVTMHYYNAANSSLVLREGDLIFFDIWNILHKDDYGKLYEELNSQFGGFTKKVKERYNTLKKVYIILACRVLQDLKFEERRDLLKPFKVMEGETEICEVVFLGEAKFEVDELYKKVTDLPDINQKTLIEDYFKIKENYVNLKQNVVNRKRDLDTMLEKSQLCEEIKEALKQLLV